MARTPKQAEEAVTPEAEAAAEAPATAVVGNIGENSVGKQKAGERVEVSKTMSVVTF